MTFLLLCRALEADVMEVTLAQKAGDKRREGGTGILLMLATGWRRILQMLSKV